VRRQAVSLQIYGLGVFEGTGVFVELNVAVGGTVEVDGIVLVALGEGNAVGVMISLAV
jgi:hypothetical protein